MTLKIYKQYVTHNLKCPEPAGSWFALLSRMDWVFKTATAILAAMVVMGTTPLHADNGLDSVLGLNRRLTFSNTSAGRVWLRPGTTMAGQDLPPELMIPLQAVNEGLVFLAAYQAKNVPAMAALGAMSLWGGTLRRGVDAVVEKATDRSLDVADLHKLDVLQLKTLAYLWTNDDVVDEKSIYLNVGGFTDRKSMQKTLEAMKDMGVVEWEHGAASARVDRDDVVRSMVAANRTDVIVNLTSGNWQ